MKIIIIIRGDPEIAWNIKSEIHHISSFSCSLHPTPSLVSSSVTLTFRMSAFTTSLPQMKHIGPCQSQAGSLHMQAEECVLP